MNTYYSMLGRLLHGKTPIHKEGYYILCEDRHVRYNLEGPLNVKVIDTEQFVQTIVNGCKEVIQSFSKSQDNQEVYAFSLYVNEYKSIYIYINNIPEFQKKLHDQYSHYEDPSYINSLKYNLGDFSFQFWSKHMSEFGQLLDDFEKFEDSPSYERDEEPLQPGDQPVIALEAGIIDSGYYALILEAVVRLKAENAFDSLNTTPNFIAFASTDNDYLNYSIMMRKTIEPDVFYTVFPDLRDMDARFEAWVSQNRRLSAGDVLDHLQDIFLDNYNSSFPFSVNRCAYDIFEQLGHLGNSLAEECLKRLHNYTTTIEQLDREQFDLISSYIEALYFAGELTLEQKSACSQLANRFLEQDEDLIDIARELNALSLYSSPF